MTTLPLASPRRLGSLLASVPLILGLAAPAQAGWVQSTNTYTYTSGNYSVIYDATDPAGQYTSSQFQTWSMTFGSPLASGLLLDINVDVGATSWTFNDGRADGNGSFDSSTGWSFISVGTNGSGEITDWLAGFAGPENSGSTSLGFSCGGAGCVAFETFFGVTLGIPELGYSSLWPDSSLANFGGQEPPVRWNDFWSATEGNPAIGFVTAFIGALALAQGGTEGDLDMAFYGPAGSVPEPGVLGLVCAGLMGTFAARRRVQRQV